MIFSLNSTLNILFLLMPLSFVLGNAITNGLSALIILLGLIKFNKAIFYFKKDLISYLLLIFFSLIIISSLANYSLSEDKFIASIIYTKYLFFTLIVKKLIEEKIINLKYFLYVAGAVSIIISLSVVIEWIIDFKINDFLLYGDAYQKCSREVLSTGIVDLTEACARNNWAVFEARTLKRFNSGLFFSEKISGGFITRFSVFVFFLLFYLKDIKSYKLKDYFIFFVILFLCQLSSLVTGNRMSFILFMLMNFLYFFVLNIDKRKLIVFFVSVSIVLSIAVFNKNLHNQYRSFYDNSKFLVTNLNKFLIKDTTEEEKKIPEYKHRGSSHKYLFKTSVQIWKENKFLGTGYKSFRIRCNDYHTKSVYGACSNHPHNYYLELMSEIGIFSIIVLFMIVITIIFRYIKYTGLKNAKNNSLNFFFYSAFLISFLVEMFPFRSSGSFVTTGDSAYIFLMIGVLMSNNLIKKLKKQ